MEQKNSSGIIPIVLLFIVLSAFFTLGGKVLDRWNADNEVLIIGNICLFGITILSFWMAKRGLRNTNPHAFVRSVYGSIMIKLFLCLILAFIYIAIYRSNLNKPALFICMGLYLVYTFLEIAALMKLLKKSSNG